jgi:hypothetical protein
MKFIKTLMQKFIKDDKKVLGRWNLDYCNKKMDTKIDLANEDHCGPCGQYALNTTISDISRHKYKIKPTNK